LGGFEFDTGGVEGLWRRWPMAEIVERGKFFCEEFFGVGDRFVPS